MYLLNYNYQKIDDTNRELKIHKDVTKIMVDNTYLTAYNLTSTENWFNDIKTLDVITEVDQVNSNYYSQFVDVNKRIIKYHDESVTRLGSLTKTNQLKTELRKRTNLTLKIKENKNIYL